MIEERFDAKPYDPQVTADDIYNCYRLLLGRTPDEFGWKTKTAIKDRLTIEELVLSFLTSPEFRNGGLFRKMLGQDEALPVPAQCDTFKIYASPDDMAVGRAIHSEGIYEPHVTAIIKNSLKPGMVFVDIGANIGYFSLLAAKLVGPNGLVLAFEPSQGSCTLLQMSAWLNHLSNIEIYPFAAAEQDSSVVFDTLMGSNGSISMALDAENSQLDRLAHKTLVRAVRLDGILAHLERIDAIKMDVEGAEYRAMVGAQELLEKHRPTVFFEFSPELLPGVSGASGRDLLLLFTEMDYTLSIIEFAGSIVDCAKDPDQVLDYHGQQSHGHLDLVAYPIGRRSERGWLKTRTIRLRKGGKA
jgi:FkbM family methyltransferase